MQPTSREQIELKLEHEVLSRFSKTTDQPSEDYLSNRLGDTSTLISKLITGYVKSESNRDTNFSIDEVLIDQFTQTHELILKLSGVVKMRKGDAELVAPFNLFMTLDRANLSFYSYTLYFEEKAGEELLFATYNQDKKRWWDVKVDWKYNWSKNLN